MRSRFVNRYPRVPTKPLQLKTPKCRCEKCKNTFVPRPRDTKVVQHPQGGDRHAVFCPYCGEDGPAALTFGSAVIYYVERHRLADK